MTLVSRRHRLGAAIALCALAVTACGGEAAVEPSPTPTPTATATPSPTPSPTQLAPLTGEAVPMDVDLDRPVLAVKVENTQAARPQGGLAQADVVYEELVEGGITRFLALFHSEVPEAVGPVRSARLVDADLLVPWRPILAYSGARADVTSTLVNTGRIGLLPDSGGPIFYRDPERSRAHDLFVYGEQAYLAGAELDNVSTFEAPWTFDEEVPDGGGIAKEVEVRMSRVSRTGWTWDAGAGVYRRSQDGEPHELVDGEIGAANVVVVLTTVGTGGCCDTAGNSFVATRMTGGGEAVVLRDGQWFTARWEKDGVADHLRLETVEGEAFPLRPGPTWVLLAPTNALEGQGPDAETDETG